MRLYHQRIHYLCDKAKKVSSTKIQNTECIKVSSIPGNGSETEHCRNANNGAPINEKNIKRMISTLAKLSHMHSFKRCPDT